MPHQIRMLLWLQEGEALLKLMPVWTPGADSSPGWRPLNNGEEFPRVVDSKANTVPADKAYDSK